MEIFVDRQSYNYEEFAEISGLKYYFLNTRKGTEEMDSVLEELLAERDEQIRAEGKAGGMLEGKAEGKAEGMLEGTVSAFISLVKEGILTVAEACRRSGISEEKFKAFMEKYDREHASVQLS